jgi:hypothetical protein
LIFSDAFKTFLVTPIKCTRIHKKTLKVKKKKEREGEGKKKKKKTGGNLQFNASKEEVTGLDLKGSTLDSRLNVYPQVLIKII